MTREEAKTINYKVGEMVKAFNTHFPLQTAGLNKYAKALKEDLTRIRAEIADYLLDNINE